MGIVFNFSGGKSDGGDSVVGYLYDDDASETQESF
jgi:hypothetical protein